MKYRIKNKKRSIKKSLVTVLALVLIISLGATNNWFGILGNHTTYAAGDLNINWNVPTGDPIFVVENMLPGDTEDRNVEVTNGGSVTRDVGVKGVKTDEIASFAGVLDFVISADGNPIYGTGSPTGPKTLQQFFNESSGPNGLPLTSLGSGNNVTYNFLATFPSSSGNEYQGAKVVFDLIIGIVLDDLPNECNIEDFNGPVIYGTSGNDKINGSSQSELIITFEGDDKVMGGGGNDYIITGAGKDKVDGQTGDDCIFTNEGDDTVSPSKDRDQIYGGEGDDKLDGGSEDDIIYGGLGKDHILGGLNNDLIYGEDGDDHLEGGTNNDQVFGGEGNDKLEGGSGVDNLKGENGNDEIYGGSDADIILGGNGNDKMEGGSGNDNINGELDTDSARGDSGIDTCVAEVKFTCEL